MRNKTDAKERSKYLKRERRLKRQQKKYCLILETSRIFEDASIRGEEFPVTLIRENGVIIK